MAYTRRQVLAIARRFVSRPTLPDGAARVDFAGMDDDGTLTCSLDGFPDGRPAPGSSVRVGDRAGRRAAAVVRGVDDTTGLVWLRVTLTTFTDGVLR
ncbi:hypothetical protein [Frankia gtarii]|uniref:hypothetical protein n=1 Tax=Frankia gtarii TaxID=2950102 RepID=UPI0021C202DC|nr:hypothetical protein [Frankia gtarii]